MSKNDPKNASQTGKWRARTGVHVTLDTGLIRALDGASEAEKSEAPGDDPYNRTIPPLDATARSRRRSLDDMRRLSEMIKTGRRSK